MAWALPTSVNLTNSNGLVYLLMYLNSVTSGWFTNMLFIAIYIIFASGFYFAKGDIFGGLAVAGFVTAVLGTIFWIAGIMQDWTFYITIAVAILSFVLLFIESQQ
jgi:hypothetical protein